MGDSSAEEICLRQVCLQDRCWGKSIFAITWKKKPKNTYLKMITQ